MNFEERQVPGAGAEQSPETPLSKNDILELARTKEAESFEVEMPKHRSFESLRKIFPRFIWEQTELDIALIEDAAPQELNPEKLETIALALAADRHERESLDQLTGLYSLKYEKEFLTEQLMGDIGDHERNNFDHLVRLSIDMNGLKTVNDENSGQHAKGNEYLKAVAETLRQSPTLLDLQVKGTQVRIARGYGDDFSVSIVGQPDETVDTESIMASLRTEIAATRLPEDILPMETVQKKLGPVPEGFTFYPSAGIGAMTAEQALAAGSQSKNTVDTPDSPKRVAQKIMGAMIDGSETGMKNDKDAYKKRLSEGSPADRYYLKLMSPRDQKLLNEIEELKRRNAELEARLNRTAG